jgi:hypothetical protein
VPSSPSWLSSVPESSRMSEPDPDCPVTPKHWKICLYHMYIYCTEYLVYCVIFFVILGIFLQLNFMTLEVAGN